MAPTVFLSSCLLSLFIGDSHFLAPRFPSVAEMRLRYGDWAEKVIPVRAGSRSDGDTGRENAAALWVFSGAGVCACVCVCVWKYPNEHDLDKGGCLGGSSSFVFCCDSQFRDKDSEEQSLFPLSSSPLQYLIHCTGSFLPWSARPLAVLLRSATVVRLCQRILACHCVPGPEGVWRRWWETASVSFSTFSGSRQSRPHWGFYVPRCFTTFILWSHKTVSDYLELFVFVVFSWKN